MPLTAQRFFDFCEKNAPNVDSVFILGDLFEYWVGDDAIVSSPFHQEVQRSIATLATKVKVYYLHGNRDFLLGPEYLQKSGMTLLNDPSKVEIAGQNYVLSHGDALCTADTGYQIFRGWVRKAWIQKLFLKMPLGWRKSIANHLRTNSTSSYQRNHSLAPELLKEKSNVTIDACAAVLRSENGNSLIHGHTHLPAHHQENLGNQEWQRWVLSDWDLDHPESMMPRASALLINHDGVRYLDLIKA